MNMLRRIRSGINALPGRVIDLLFLIPLIRRVLILNEEVRNDIQNW